MEPFIEDGEIAVPEPQDGQVLIKTRLANINPSDLHFIKGEYGQPRRKGLPAGFEGVGDVWQPRAAMRKSWLASASPSPSPWTVREAGRITR